MTYKIFSIDGGKKYLWGTFSNDQEKMFLFVSYLLNTNTPEDFYIIEEETDRAVTLISFADFYGITKNDIKK